MRNMTGAGIETTTMTRESINEAEAEVGASPREGIETKVVIIEFSNQLPDKILPNRSSWMQRNFELMSLLQKVRWGLRILKS